MMYQQKFVVLTYLNQSHIYVVPHIHLHMYDLILSDLKQAFYYVSRSRITFLHLDLYAALPQLIVRPNDVKLAINS